MSDRTFQWSLTGFTVVVIAWIVTGITLRLLPAVAVIIIAVMVEFLAGGYLLHLWGKHFLQATEDNLSGSVELRKKTAYSNAVTPIPSERGRTGKIVPQWQITTTTVNCVTAGHDVTISIHKEWTAVCNYHEISLGCKELAECPYINEYRGKLVAEGNRTSGIPIARINITTAG